MKTLLSSLKTNVILIYQVVFGSALFLLFAENALAVNAVKSTLGGVEVQLVLIALGIIPCMIGFIVICFLTNFHFLAKAAIGGIVMGVVSLIWGKELVNWVFSLAGSSYRV